jgi:SAM-dependent methyltransferase
MLRMGRPDFSKRSFASEWLDTNGQSQELPHYLRDLAWFNSAALGPWAITRWLKRAMRRIGGNSFSLLDIGCGGGDILRTIAHWAARRGLRADLAGIDLNPNTIAIARARIGGIENLSFHAADVFAFTLAQPPDLIISSLLAHHLDDAHIVDLLRWMNAHARHGWLIYDLQRSAILHCAIGALGTLTGLHPMVVHDGQISVMRALTRAEWRDRITAAKLDPTQVRIDGFLFRLLVSSMSRDELSCGPSSPSVTSRTTSEVTPSPCSQKDANDPEQP